MILLRKYSGDDEMVVAPVTVYGFDLGPRNFADALSIILRDNFSNLRYAHWCDEAALMAGLSVRTILAVFVTGGIKIATYVTGPNGNAEDALIARIAAYHEAGITPDDVENVIGNLNDAREYRALLA